MDTNTSYQERFAMYHDLFTSAEANVRAVMQHKVEELDTLKSLEENAKNELENVKRLRVIRACSLDPKTKPEVLLCVNMTIASKGEFTFPMPSFINDHNVGMYIQEMTVEGFYRAVPNPEGMHYVDEGADQIQVYNRTSTEKKYRIVFMRNVQEKTN